MKQKLLPEILSDIVQSMLFPIKYKTSVDNLDGTYTLGGICDIRHLQPGFTVTIDGVDFEVKDYLGTVGNWYIVLHAGTNSLPAPMNTFNLYKPFFFHGTPIEQQNELTLIPLSAKIPMIYLIEPYVSEDDYSAESSIYTRAKPTLAFLTEAVIKKQETADLYHNAVEPMNRLRQDFIRAVEVSNLFYTNQLKTNPKFFAKFGINIQDAGSKKQYFADNLSGCSDVIPFEVYRDDRCCGMPLGFNVANESAYGGFLRRLKQAEGFGVNYTGTGTLQYQQLIGAIDGSNKRFKIPEETFISGTLVPYYNGNREAEFIPYPATGEFEFNFIPADDAVISAQYEIAQ